MSEELDKAVAFIAKAYGSKRGDPEFANELVALATRSCQAIEHLERDFKHSMREIAKHRVDWPMLQYATTEPKGDEGEKRKTKELETRMKSLALGENLPVRVDPKHNEFTITILKHVESICEVKRGDEPVRPTATVSQEDLDHGVCAGDNQWYLDEFWFHDINEYRLPELTLETVQLWAECISSRILFEADLQSDEIEMEIFGLERQIDIAVPIEFYERANDILAKSRRRSIKKARDRAHNKERESACSSISATWLQEKEKEIQSRTNLDDALVKAARDRVSEVLNRIMK